VAIDCSSMETSWFVSLQSSGFKTLVPAVVYVEQRTPYVASEGHGHCFQASYSHV
jgi:hypothetical protein